MQKIIVKRRKELNMTQQDLAKKLNVSDKVISKWETGRSIPDTSLLIPLSQALEISVNELLDDVSSSENNLKNKSEIEMKLKNNLIITCFIEAIGCLLVSFSTHINHNHHGNTYDIFYKILLILGIILISFAIVFFVVNENRLKIKDNYNGQSKIMNLLNINLVYYLIMTIAYIKSIEFIQYKFYEWIIYFITYSLFGVIPYIIIRAVIKRFNRAK
ncbi:MAG: helix-turn-helix transcriptional regulator [Bacilli bacterium]|nr:helix-turn-helix transcriptional regulator [Bacilli bacterium]